MLHFTAFRFISYIAMDAFTWGKWILLAAFLLDFYFKIILETFH